MYNLVFHSPEMWGKISVNSLDDMDREVIEYFLNLDLHIDGPIPHEFKIYLHAGEEYILFVFDPFTGRFWIIVCEGSSFDITHEDTWIHDEFYIEQSNH